MEGVQVMYNAPLAWIVLLRTDLLESGTATKISLPLTNEDVNEFTITGTRDGIEAAIHKINEVFEPDGKVIFNFNILQVLF